MEVKVFDNVSEIVRDDMLDTIKRGSKISVAAACFSMYAYKELKKQLESVDKFRFIFYSGTLVKTKIDKFLNVSGSRHCSIEQQCREVALCWRDVPDG